MKTVNPGFKNFHLKINIRPSDSIFDKYLSWKINQMTSELLNPWGKSTLVPLGQKLHFKMLSVFSLLWATQKRFLNKNFSILKENVLACVPDPFWDQVAPRAPEIRAPTSTSCMVHHTCLWPTFYTQNEIFQIFLQKVWNKKRICHFCLKFSAKIVK